MTATTDASAVRAGDGILPAKQQRSQRRQREILDAAHRLLDQVGYEKMKMEDIATEANCSVGSLYQRFRKKEGLLDAMLEEVAVQLGTIIETELGTDRLRAKDRRAALGTLIGLVVDFMRDNQAFVRAITQRQLMDRNAVSPLQGIGRLAAGRTWSHLAANFEECRTEGAKGHFDYGLQIVIGVCTNAVLNRPGPLQIDDPALPEGLLETMDATLMSSFRTAPPR